MRQVNLFDEIIVDNFAGGGGASTGMELATSRPVAIAINQILQLFCFTKPTIRIRNICRPLSGMLTRLRYARAALWGWPGSLPTAGILVRQKVLLW